MAQEKIEKIIQDILEMDADEKESFLKYTKEHSVKYLLCMDMGCGGTSVVFYNLEHGNIYPVKWRYKKSNMVTGEWMELIGTSIPTIIGYNTDQEELSCYDVIIGPEAFTYGRALENFKRLPETEVLHEKVITIQNMYEEEYSYSLAKVWADYFGEILEGSLKFLKEEMHCSCNKEELLFVAAHPSGEEWSEKEILANYKNIIKQGTGLAFEQILTISEAKAAMQYVRKLHNISVDWSKGVLIIDLGASTIDIEYLSKNCTDPKEYSITMAGKEADKILAYDILYKSNPKFKMEYPTADDFLWDEAFWKEEKIFEEKMEALESTRAEWMYTIRCLKETICESNIFGAEPQGIKAFGKMLYYMASHPETEIPFSELTVLEDLLEQTEFSFACNDMMIANYMNQNNHGNGAKGAQIVKGSWYSHLNKLLSYVLKELQEEQYSISDIIVTGGTSCLVGVEKHIKQTIEASALEKKEEIHIVFLSGALDYERTVPFGSCYYVGNAIKHMDEICSFPIQLRKRLDDTIKGKKILSKYIAQALMVPLYNAIEKAVVSWSNLSYASDYSSLNGLEEFLKDKINEIPQQKLDACIQQGVLQFQKENEKAMSEVYHQINQFLTNLLSEKQNKSYQIQIPNIKIQININDTNQIVSAIGKRIQGLRVSDFTNSFNNFLGILLALIVHALFILGNIDQRKIRWMSHYRKKVVEELPEMREGIWNDLTDMIHEEVMKTYLQKEGFHLEEQILEAISDDVKRALYLS